MVQQALFIGISHSKFSELSKALFQEPYELQWCESGSEALTYLATHEVCVVLCEEVLIDGSGPQYLVRIKQQSSQCIRILLETSADKSELLSAINKAEVYRILSSPLQPSTIAQSLREAMLLYRVASVQSAIWNAAKLQHQALTLFANSEAPQELTKEVELMHSRYTPGDQDESLENECIGELPRTHAEKLSSREREIVRALGSGKRVKEIAQDLLISTHTVRNHLKAIYRKLNVRSQFELLSLMARHARSKKHVPET